MLGAGRLDICGRQLPVFAENFLVESGGMVAAWNLDEESGTRFDSVGSNNLTDNSTVGFVADGKVGNAADFVAANSEYLSIADNSNLSTGDVAFWGSNWVRRQEVSASNKPVIYKWNHSANQREWFFLVAGSGSSYQGFFGVSHNGTNTALVNTTNGVTIGDWHHFLYWHDEINNTINVRRDNDAVNSVAHTFGVLDSNSEFRVGADGQSAGAYWEGEIDKIAFGKPPGPIADVIDDIHNALYAGGSPSAF